MSRINHDLTSQIEADHERLNQMIASLERFLSEEPEHFVDWKVNMLFQLRDFHNQLAKHFDLEEEGGFISDLLRLAPQAANRIQRLPVEHERMLNRLDGTISDVKALTFASSGIRDRLRKRVEDVVRRFRDHESLECELLYHAHYQEFGVGD